MNKLTIGVVAAVVVTGAAGTAALPWYLGWRTEHGFAEVLRQTQAGNANSPLAITLVQYRRGWLSSEVTHRISMKSDPDAYFTIKHADEVGNAAAFLCSDLASGITGEVLYVDAGYSHVGMAFPEDEK